MRTSSRENATELPVEHSAKARVFISYSRKDLAFADPLEAALKARGFAVAIDRSDVYAFEPWWKRIETLIAGADTVVFVLSPDSVASEIALKEVAFASSLNKRFAPIVCRRVDNKAVPEPLARFNFIFFDDAAHFEANADKLAEALHTDIAWIRQHTQFGEEARRWSLANRPNGLLLRSPALEEAERWIAARPESAPAPTEEMQAFFRHSRQAATRRRNLLTASLTAGLFFALGLAGLAYWQRGIAVEQRRIAERNEAQARIERDTALLNESRFLAGLARQHVSKGDGVSAILLALEGLTERGATPRPWSKEAQLALYEGLESQQEVAVRGSFPGTLLNSGAGLIDGCLVTLDVDALIHTCHDEHRDRVYTQAVTSVPKLVAINKIGTRLATYSDEDDFINIKDLTGLGQNMRLSIRRKDVHAVRLNDDGGYLLVLYLSKTSPGVMEIIDVRNGKAEIIPDEFANEVSAVDFSIVGSSFVIARMDNALFVCASPYSCVPSKTQFADAPAFKNLDNVFNRGDYHPSEILYDSRVDFIAIRFMYSYSLGSHYMHFCQIDFNKIYSLTRSQNIEQKGDVVLYKRKLDADFQSLMAGDHEFQSGVSAANFSSERTQFELLVAFTNDVVKSIAVEEFPGTISTDRWRLGGHVDGIRFVARDGMASQFITMGNDKSVRTWNYRPQFDWASELKLETFETAREEEERWEVDGPPKRGPGKHYGSVVEIEGNMRQSFLEKIGILLGARDSNRIRVALEQVPRCLGPERRKKLNLSPEPPFWCEELGKWPYDTPKSNR